MTWRLDPSQTFELTLELEACGLPNQQKTIFASRYPTASTIYCADDPAWHELSPTYLVHFATFERAKARFPGYHLHQPC